MVPLSLSFLQIICWIIFPYLELSIEIEKHNIQKLVNLLQYSPNLESLVFVKGVDPRVCFDEEDWIWNPVPKCFLACLKSGSLHNFHGNYAEMRLLRCLLKNALFLERLKVFGSKNLSGDSKMQSEVMMGCKCFLEHPQVV